MLGLLGLPVYFPSLLPSSLVLRYLLFQYTGFTLFTCLPPILATFLPGIGASTLPVCWVYLVYPFTSHPCHLSSLVLRLLLFHYAGFSWFTRLLPILATFLPGIEASSLLACWVYLVYPFTSHSCHFLLCQLSNYFYITSPIFWKFMSMVSTLSMHLVYLVYPFTSQFPLCQ